MFIAQNSTMPMGLHAERITERDCAPFGLMCSASLRQAELAHAGERLRGERFVQLDDVEALLMRPLLGLDNSQNSVYQYSYQLTGRQGYRSMPRQHSIAQRYPWAEYVFSPDTIVPHRVPFPLVRRFNQICATVVAEILAEQQIRPGGYSAIATIDDFPGIDQRRLATTIGVDRTNAGQIVGELEAKGLIKRRVNGADRRARELSLTPAGKKLRRRFQPKLLAAQDAVLAVLAPQERKVLIELLVRVVEANEAYARPGAGRRPPRRKSKATSHRLSRRDNQEEPR
jgi:DNA-binding MarR family transcriptional regulator